MDKYNLLSNKYLEEKKIKIEIIQSLKNYKPLLKEIKISKNVVENELLNEKKISMITIKALCFIYNINVFYIKNSVYYKILPDSTQKEIKLINQVDENFGYKNFVSSFKIDYYKENFWELENIGKPMKAISSYKVDEIKDIAKKLKIDLFNKNQSKRTKKELYENISIKLNNN